MMLRLSAAAALLCALPLAAGADGKRPHRPPPPEAVEACRERAPGDACTVTLRDHTVDGVCREAPDGEGPLACVPDRPPPGPPPGPPPEKAPE
jgi:hypothetical protein